MRQVVAVLTWVQGAECIVGHGQRFWCGDAAANARQPVRYTMDQPIAVGVERGALARALMPYFQDLSRKNGIYAHIEQIQIGGSSKTNRVTYALQGMFEHGRITMNSRENWDVFKKEYMNFPSKKVHDDTLDSLSLIQNLVTTTYSKYEAGVQEWKPLDEVTGL